MSLISDLITEVVDSSSDLSQVLRKAKVLASELRSEELRAWSEAELNGYKDQEGLPDYRVSGGTNFGNFVGSWGRRATIPIPLLNLPKLLRQTKSKLELQEGAAALQKMMSSETDYQEQWNPDAVAAVANDVLSDMTMISAWMAIPKARIAAVLDAIRNRLLSFLLELKEKHPGVDAADADLKSISKEDVRVSVVNNIYGGQNVLASGETVHQQVQQGLKPGDLESLLSLLRDASLPEELVSELPEAIEKDEPNRKGGIGPRVSGWLATVAEKMVSNAPVAFATQALLQYYGLAGP